MKRHIATAVAALMLLSACSGAGGRDAGGGERTVVVGADLVFHGTSARSSNTAVEAMRLYLEQVGGRAGKVKVELKLYDSSTAEKGSWDEATCARNARAHLANAAEVAVVGPPTSGCAKAQTPLLAGEPGGPLLMVSHASTNPGLTKRWAAGEPERYQPGGVRSFARVITTDDYQGSTAAQFAANQLGVERCFVLNDGQTYGQGVARTFTAEARRRGITVVGEQAWDAGQASYAALFAEAKAARADCVYLGGTVGTNGLQLIRDKVRALGDNSAVKLLVPDGFTGRPAVAALPEAQGMYLTFAGLAAEQLQLMGGNAARFGNAFRTRYGRDIDDNYALYAVQALQVILEAIEESDGTRKGVHAAVFGRDGLALAATTAVLDKAIHIDPATGDVSAHDVTVLQLRGGKEIVIRSAGATT